MQNLIRSRFGALACVGAFVYMPRTSTSCMADSNKTIEELEAMVTQQLEVLKSHLGAVNMFFCHMVAQSGQENVWVATHAAYGESAARVLDELGMDTKALFKLVGKESSS